VEYRDARQGVAFEGILEMADSFLLTGSEALARRKNFKLVGRGDKFDELCTILTRMESNSVIVSGPSGVGVSSLALALQARKADDDAPFDIVNKRLFWLDTDALFALGDNAAIIKQFQGIFSILNRTPDSVLIIEDTLDLIDALRNSGLMHIINALTSMVKSKKTQMFLEVREADLTAVLKCHSDFRDHFTLMDLTEPAGDELEQIAMHSARELEENYSVKIDRGAVITAIEMSNKYRSLDTGLNRAQPERTRTLLDRAMSRYLLDAHSTPPMLHELEAELAGLSKKQPSSDVTAKIATVTEAIARHKAEFAERQTLIKKYFMAQRDGEKSIVLLEGEVRDLEEIEKNRHLDSGSKKPEAKPDAKSKYHDADFDLIAQSSGYATPEITAKRKTIELLETAVKENRVKYDAITREINDRLLLTRDMVIEEFSRISDIDVSKLKQDDKVKLVNLGGVLKRRIFGQDEALEHVVAAVKVWKRGRRTDKPLPFLFCGPSGVGKTEITKGLAEGLFDTEKALNRYDMGEFMEKNDVTKMIGAPPGYDGFSAGGEMTNSVRSNPYQVMLWDEIEKAHPDIFNICLNILDDGRCRDNLGRKVEFGDIVMPMTTNIGAEHALRVGTGPDDISEEEALELTIRDLKKVFRPEFLNRFEGRENILLFKKLNMGTIEKIAVREITRVNEFYNAQQIDVTFPETQLREFCDKVYAPEIGARGIPGKIKKIESLIVDQLILDESFKGCLNIGFDPKTKGFTSNWTKHERKAA
jgi:ATP-dependent Clp protease ATP-binding subunit ClpB